MKVVRYLPLQSSDVRTRTYLVFTLIIDQTKSNTETQNA